MKRLSFFLLVAVVVLSACKEKPLDPSKTVYVTISTSMGDVTVRLYDDTPLHKANFIKLCQSGEYEGVIFHRIIKDFVVQGGDPHSKAQDPKARYGSYSGGYTVPAEILPEKYFNKRGALIDAKQGDDTNPERASAGTQFCFVQGKVQTDADLDNVENRINDIQRNWLFHKFKAELQKEQPGLPADSLENLALLRASDQLAAEGRITIPPERREVYKTIGGAPHLDGSVTIFGEVTEGFDIVEKMSLVETNSYDCPVENVVIRSTKAFN